MILGHRWLSSFVVAIKTLEVRLLPGLLFVEILPSRGWCIVGHCWLARHGSKYSSQLVAMIAMIKIIINQLVTSNQLVLTFQKLKATWKTVDVPVSPSENEVRNTWVFHADTPLRHLRKRRKRPGPWRQGCSHQVGDIRMDALHEKTFQWSWPCTSYAYLA